MVLLGYSWGGLLMGMMWVSLGVLLIVILYRRLLRSFSKDAITKEDYCELYSLEIEPASGELPFYFTSNSKRLVSLSLLDGNMSFLQVIEEKECKVGGNIIRFDSTKVPNGEYFYCLKTENQKVAKKMHVLNV